MIVPAYLLFMLGLLGATDIVLFHKRAHDLHSHRPARGELVTHFLRGPTYCALFALVPNFTFHGAWALGLYGLLAFDLAISIADFALEPASRRAKGGLPGGEYLLHVVMAMLFGALVSSVLYEAPGAAAEPTALCWASRAAPVPRRMALGVMAPLVLLTGLSDLRACLRLRE